MSQYRRLISYIYAYEGGVKGKNIGYAKIEVRGGQCRIQVSVKKIYVGSSEVGVYLLTPGEELFLGRIFVRNGVGEYRSQVSAENIEGSGCGIDQCYGLTIHDVESAWQSYTTIWEDAVARAAQVELEEVTAENVRRRMERYVSETEKEQKSQPQEEKTEPVVRFPVSAQIEEELAREESRLEAVPPWEPEDVGEEESREIPDGTEAADPQRPAEKTDGEKTDNSEEESAVVPGPEDAAQLEELDRLEDEGVAAETLWKRLEGLYSKILAFEYDKACEILSIKPQDIGLLPREIWIYGNNSFLLHGYYNYRHLILARLENPKGVSRYLLGVPGHYFRNEKYLASMFGFPHFVLSKNQPEDDGRFGYWYTDIRL
ncbi:MAG: DUF6128 domain-containing protein [Clostridiales bacterium]|nr:DUF6128 domain-containing protein [Clostridiales bacterium]